MSKSIKKYPIVRQEKEDYKYLNRQIRRDKYAKFTVPGAFKRHRSHWNWSYRWSKDQAKKQWYEDSHTRKLYPTLEEWLNYWEKCTIRK